MSIALFSLINISLFMLHEFEEMVMVKPWIEAQKDIPAYQKELFIQGRKHYPSTESIALMIGEEFLLVSLISIIASICDLPELALALLIGHLFHLLAHIGEWLRYRRFVPGSCTVLLTFPILVGGLLYFFLVRPVNGWLLLVLTPLVLALILANLRWLHRQSEKIDHWIQRVVK
ncbi:HXXEE domain-containing protein [Streptococcus merionis]|uniref:HXXEE domain-containing protein n=1 Tax=Streptococcus merionis TaxID=400065 RepID=UPI0026F0466D|nr:HXXEE domain-containing protein [Streptococcus merionis]